MSSVVFNEWEFYGTKKIETDFYWTMNLGPYGFYNFMSGFKKKDQVDKQSIFKQSKLLIHFTFLCLKVQLSSCKSTTVVKLTFANLLRKERSVSLCLEFKNTWKSCPMSDWRYFLARPLWALIINFFFNRTCQLTSDTHMCNVCACCYFVVNILVFSNQICEKSLKVKNPKFLKSGRKEWKPNLKASHFVSEKNTQWQRIAQGISFF
jgi:hypothetical protein